MSTFVLSFVVVALAFAGLAAGVVLGRGSIRGSCGGLGNCPTCTTKCRRERS